MSGCSLLSSGLHCSAQALCCCCLKTLGPNFWRELTSWEARHGPVCATLAWPRHRHRRGVTIKTEKYWKQNKTDTCTWLVSRGWREVDRYSLRHIEEKEQVVLVGSFVYIFIWTEKCWFYCPAEIVWESGQKFLNFQIIVGRCKMWNYHPPIGIRGRP